VGETETVQACRLFIFIQVALKILREYLVTVLSSAAVPLVVFS
jgi:hypothetical protein